MGIIQVVHQALIGKNVKFDCESEIYENDGKITVGGCVTHLASSRVKHWDTFHVCHAIKQYH